MTSYFYSQDIQNKQNDSFLKALESYAESTKTLLYVLDRPLTDLKYTYIYSTVLILLSPKHKIAIINYGDKEDNFENYVEDVVEDIASISDKYQYRDVIGRPRNWKNSLIDTTIKLKEDLEIKDMFDSLRLDSDQDIKKMDLLISLFIGSINDIDRVKDAVPLTTLDKIKQKILLFDGDQTRFIYQTPDKKQIRIQGLSGTGKTELLLHKLKDLYTNDPTSKIYFTCHSKILADSLKKRIPSFFNFMKVEQQIEWDKRLWCSNSWGSAIAPNSGAYRYICAVYQIPFLRYSPQMPFSKVCELAVNEIKSRFTKGDRKFAFTYMFIDESQDFNESFIELCDLVTEKNIYIAGDIFQSIFDENISSTIEPDFLLGKCYRTDPKTLMFAHGLGMGLFEDLKLRWLEEKEWRDCGYNVNVKANQYLLNREPLRRFEDLEENFESIRIVEITESNSDTVIDIISEIIKENETVRPDDIGIVLLDQNNSIYKLADILEIKIHENFKWMVNKAYETKENIPNTVFISNRFNVKGLEFPFVICITDRISNSASYRNSLYTMLTRSFIKSFLVLTANDASGLTQGMRSGLLRIIQDNVMVINEPSAEEKVKIRTRFKNILKTKSHYDLMMQIFIDLDIDSKYHDKIFQSVQQMEMVDSDEETLIQFVTDNLKYIKLK